MARGDKFVSGTSILWGKLAKATVGTVILSGALGFAAIQNAIGAAWFMLSAGVSGFLTDLSAAVIAGPARGLVAVWQAPLSFVRVLGPWAPVFAVGLVLVTLYLGPMVVTDG